MPCTLHHAQTSADLPTCCCCCPLLLQRWLGLARKGKGDKPAYAAFKYYVQPQHKEVRREVITTYILKTCCLLLLTTRPQVLCAGPAQGGEPRHGAFAGRWAVLPLLLPLVLLLL